MSARSSGWSLLTRRGDPAAKAPELYGRLVAQAREVPFYAELGVPDTPEGRLELVLLHMVLMLRRLQRDGERAAELARALSETFVTDMDDCLREMGVGDLSVAKKVKKAAAALFDRNRDYGARLDAGDHAGLARLLTEWLPTNHGGRIAGYAFAAEADLTAAATTDLIAGRTRFPTP